jgi:DNA repair exonuclease SbcCD ATPase subunit
MPQVEQLQVVYWGSLRADPVDLAVDGINVATGPNGSGKTTSLDALKLILGISDLGRRPAEYIYDGGGEASQRAERALVKAIFANPLRPGRAGRVFADAGRGCESSAHVTAVCEVTRDNRRRFALLPGPVIWGTDGRHVEHDVHAMRSRIPGSQWMTARTWDELLARAGVSRALRGVIAVKQGETDKTIEGSPEALLRRVLELTGKQDTLEEFREAKTRLIEAREAYDEANERLAAERRHLQALNVQATQHHEYVRERKRATWIAEVGMPAATRIAREAEREALARERDGQAATLTRDRGECAALEGSIPELQEQAARLETDAEKMRNRERDAREEYNKAADARASAYASVQSAQRLIDDALRLAGSGPLDRERADAAQQQALLEREQLAGMERAIVSLREEISDLEAGRPKRPSSLDGFRAVLSDAGISNELIAESLEVGEAVAAEATLADGIWALVVPADRLDAAVDLAKQHAHRLPLAAAGPGSPHGVLVDASGLDSALAYLAEIDLPLAAPGVSSDGVVRGQHWAVWRAPERPVLGHQARVDRLTVARAELESLEAESPALGTRAEQALAAAGALSQAVPAAAEIGALQEVLADAEGALREKREATEALAASMGDARQELGRIEVELGQREQRLSELTRGINERGPLLDRYDQRLSAIDDELVRLPSIPDDLDIEGLPGVDALRGEADSIASRIDDEVRFPEEVRSELIIVHQHAQEQSMAEVEQLLGGRREDLEAVETEVEKAKQRYDEHIRQVVHLLARRFREVCEQAGMDGDIELRAGDVEGEFGIEVKVAHVRGETKRSYRSAAHSSGQRAKISLLILLAAMGLEGSADLLIMDEHAAHLDSRNIDAVAEVMNALKHRVQFILATPTNAEAGRLSWCDHQIAFYPRASGEHFAPPVRLYTRAPENGERYADMGQLALAD